MKSATGRTPARNADGVFPGVLVADVELHGVACRPASDAGLDHDVADP
ncbi:MAG TPA: hypothetical protein VHV74_12945 [Pseudonocardiaceae bacterium]|jgi:hypothetical protein|nr:hypothetical protein [Pseudonocardiaceae bacterium]